MNGEDVVIIRLELDSNSIDQSTAEVKAKLDKQLDKSLTENINSQLSELGSSLASFFKAAAVAATAAIAGYGLYLAATLKTGTQILGAYKALFADVLSLSKGFLLQLRGFLTSSFSTLGGVLKSIPSFFSGLKKDFADLSGYFAGGTRNIFAFADAMITSTGKLTALAVAVNFFGEEVAGLSTSVINLATGISLGLTVAVVSLIHYAAELAYNLGTRLSAAFHRSYEAFIEFRKETVIFTETINAFNRATDGAIGTTESWGEEIKVLSKELNFTIGDLRKSAAEIVTVGTRLDLSREQMEQLLRVSAEYARISGKDLYQTTVNFASALNGNSQAVLAYGVKLTEANNAQFALKSGMKESFATMTEHQKSQIRFNNLMKQYSDVAGVATTVANDWFNQTKKLEITMDNLNTQVGLGAAYVEDLNLGAFALNKILGNVSDGVARLFGFLGAFGSRILQVTGLIIEWGFKIFLAYRSLQLLDLLLKSRTWLTFASSTLPILGKSLDQVAKSAVGAQASLYGLRGSFGTIFEGIKKNRAAILSFFTGLGGGAAATGTALSVLGARLAVALTAIKTFMVGFLVIAGPFLVKFALIGAAIALVVKAFIEIENRTQFFSAAFESATRRLQPFFAFFRESGPLFKQFASGITDVIGKAVGFTTLLFAKWFEVISYVVSKNPLKVFSKETALAFEEVKRKLAGFSDEIIAANGNFFALGNTAQASLNKIKTDKVEVDLQKLNDLLSELSKNSLSEAGAIRKELNERLALITQGMAAEVLAEKAGSEAKQLARLDSIKKVNTLIEQEIGSSGLSIKEKEKKIYDDRLSLINNLLQNELISMARANDLKKQILDDFNDKIEKSADKQISEQKRVMKQFSITADQADRAISIMQTTVEAGTNLMVGSFQRLGAQLIEGGAAWSDFRSFALDIIGSFLIQVGTAVMGLGAAVNAVAVSLASLNGFAAIAAGAALIIAGGALKALAGGGSTSYTPGAGGTVSRGGGVTGVGGGPGYEDRDTGEREKPNPNITINIEGSLFSTEQTSKTIIDMIGKEFDKSGANIRRRSFA